LVACRSGEARRASLARNKAYRDVGCPPKSRLVDYMRGGAPLGKPRLHPGSERAALTTVLSLATISAGVVRDTPKPPRRMVLSPASQSNAMRLGRKWPGQPARAPARLTLRVSQTVSGIKAKSLPYLLTDSGQFDILLFGPGWRGSDAIRSTTSARVRHAARRRGGGMAARGARAAAQTLEALDIF